jgi:hypothetical protein
MNYYIIYSFELFCNSYPPIGGGAIRLVEAEGLERLNFVYIFCNLRRPDKKMGNLTHIGDNCCANSSDPYTYVKQDDTQGVTNKLQRFFIFRQFRQKRNRQGERIFKLKRILHCVKRFFFPSKQV